MKKNWLFYIGIFLFFTLILFLCPIAGDDWGNFFTSKTGNYIDNAVYMHLNWEGRFVSRLLINLLSSRKWIWNIINSIIITGLIYISIKFLNPKSKKLVYLGVVLIFLLMNIYVFSQTVTWIAGNLTYLFVIPLILGYFLFLISKDTYSKWYIVLFSTLNFIMTMFVEHMAAVLIVGNIAILVYKYIKNKKLDKRIILYLIFSIIGFALMLFSPGNTLRKKSDPSFNGLNIFEKLLYNIPNFVYFTFITNSFMLGLMNIAVLYLIKNTVKLRWLRLILFVFMLSLSSLTIFIYPLSNFITLNINFLINQNNIFIQLYWIFYLVIFAILLLLNCIKEKNYSPSFLILLGLSANGAMMLSPTWGWRTTFFTYLCFSLSSLWIIDKSFSSNKIIDFVLGGIIVVASCFYVVLYANAYICEKDMRQSIKQQVKQDREVIEIIEFPHFVNCNINPTNDYHIAAFKSYYNIPEDKELKLVDKWKYVIFYIG